MKRFVHCINGDVVNLDHVVRFEEIKNCNYRCIDTTGDELGVVTVDEINRLDESVISDTTGAVLVSFGLWHGTNDLDWTRERIIAWKQIPHEPPIPIAPSGGADSVAGSEVWCVELGGTWTFPDDSAVSSFDAAAAHAKKKLLERRERAEAVRRNAVAAGVHDS